MKKLASYCLAALAALLLLVLVLELWRLDVNVPLVYGYGDALASLMAIKAILDHGWYLYNPHLGAPFSLYMHDYPASDSVNFFLLKVIGSFFPTVGATINLFFLATFVLTTVSSYFVFRRFKIAPSIGLVCALLYAFMPYHFWRGLSHLLLAAYYMVPIITLLALEAWGDDPPMTSGGRFAWSKRTFWALLACLVIGSTGVYYAFFGCLLLGVASVSRGVARRSLKAMLPGLGLVLVIAATVVVNLTPSVIFSQTNGKNLEAVVRDPAQTEIFAMKISQLILPMADHRLPAFQALGAKYRGFPLPNEATETLGILATIGLFSLFIRRLRLTPSASALSDRLSVLNLSAVLLGTIGGFGTLFALLFSDSIRAYNRISIFIAFFCLFEIALLLEWLRQRYFKSGWQAKSFAAGMPFLLGIGMLDQTIPAFVPSYEAAKQEFTTDQAFVRKLEASLPAEAMIFQLPAVPYPEHPPVHRLGDYELFRGYLHSRTLRWSYGSMKGRNNNWARWIGNQPVDRLLPALAAAGFQGIYLDRNGFADSGAALETELKKTLGVQPMVSGNDRLAYYDLTAYYPGFRREHPDQEVSTYRTVLTGLAANQAVHARVASARTEIDQLYAAGNAYLRMGKSLPLLDPDALVAARLLPPYWGSRAANPDHHNWTPSGGWIGAWQDQHFAVGIDGMYESLVPTIEAYRSRASHIYFPYPKLLEGPLKANERGQLLMVFPTATSARLRDAIPPSTFQE